MDEKFKTSLELDISKFKEGIERVKETFKNVGNVAKKDVVMDTSNLKEYSAEQQYIISQIDDIKHKLDLANKGFEVGDVLKLESDLDRLNKKLNDTNKQVNKLGNIGNNIQKGFEKGMKSAKRFTLSLFGIQSVYRMLSRASSSYLSQDQETSKKIQSAWIGLGSIFAPLLEKIATFTIKAVKYINVFIKALTGVDFLARAMDKSMKKANKTAGKLSKTLAGFDELTNLDDSSSGADMDTSWIDAFKDVELDPSITNFFQKLGNALKPVYEGVQSVVKWFQTLDSTTQILMGILGLGGLLGLLTGKSGLVIGFAAVGFGVLGMIKIFDEDLTTSVEGLMSLLGAAGLVGILIGGSKGMSVAGAIAGVSFALFGLNEYINGDTTEAIEGLILLLGGAGLAGAFIGGTKGMSVGLAIASVISIIQGFNDLLSGDTTKNIKGFISLVTGSAGLIFTLGLLKGGLVAVNIPLLISVAGFAALAGGVLLVTKNWGKMNTLEKVVSILGLIAVGAAAAAAAVGALQSAWSLGIAAAAIVAGTAAIAASVSNANKRARENIPKLDVGTNYVPEDTLAVIHKGEAVVPKKFNSSEYFGSGNDETNSLLRVLIETLEEKDMSVSIDKNAIGQASADYINSQKRIMGRGVI